MDMGEDNKQLDMVKEKLIEVEAMLKGRDDTGVDSVTMVGMLTSQLTQLQSLVESQGDPHKKKRRSSGTMSKDGQPQASRKDFEDEEEVTVDPVGPVLAALSIGVQAAIQALESINTIVNEAR